MIKHILYCILLILSFTPSDMRGQVYAGTWAENFESMTVNQTPSGGWASIGGFSVFPAPHGNTDITGTKAISKNLGPLANSDSVFSPKITYVTGSSWLCMFYYRICDWSGGIPVAPTVLAAGDTCYLSIYKYTGSVVSGKTLLRKFYSGNHFQPTTSFVNHTSYQNLNVVYTDTFRVAIHVKRGPAGNYWYDFDDFLVVPTVSVGELNNNSPMNIYPNPTNGSIYITGASTDSNSEVYNTMGQIIIESKKINSKGEIDLKHQPAGIYFIKINSDDKTIVRKVVKE